MRESKEVVKLTGSFTFRDSCDSSNNQVLKATRSVTLSSNRSAGVRVPGWKRKIAGGTSATSPLHGLSQKILYRSDPEGGRSSACYQHSPCLKGCSASYNGWLHAQNFNLANTASIFDPGMTAASNKAIAAFTQEVNDRISPFKGGVFIGELRETVKLLRHPVKGLRDLIEKHNVRIRGAINRFHRQRDFSRQVLNAAAESWLETQYGWGPLVSDLQSAAKALDHVFGSRDRVSTRRSVESYSHEDYGYIGYGPTIECHADADFKKSYDCKLVGAVALDPRDGTLPSRLGIRLPELIPTIEELIPYSFILDYFSNMQEFLYSTCAPIGGRVNWWNQTDVAQTYTVFRNSFGFSAASLNSTGTSGVIIGRARNWSRLGGNGDSFPHVTLTFGSELNWKKIINLTALLQQSRLTSGILRKRSS